MDLRNKHGQEFYFTTIGWAFYINLAILHYGWEAIGTVAPRNWDGDKSPWQGEYDWNAGQVVAAQDAIAFAIALNAYIADPAREEKKALLAKMFHEEAGISVELDVDDRELITAFIEFALKGEFETW
ncbi:hypothetical protein [Chitinimonas prasina]|nr:hypothetical protein [Chitinimonas prasina]